MKPPILEVEERFRLPDAAARRAYIQEQLNAYLRAQGRYRS